MQKVVVESGVALILFAVMGCGDQESGDRQIYSGEENTQTLCDNGIDDDGDSYTDCSDQDCWDFLVCNEPDADDPGDDHGDDESDLSDDGDDEDSTSVTAVCGQDYQPPSWHPETGSTVAFLTVFGMGTEDDQLIELEGPTSLRMPTLNGCSFITASGDYHLSVIYGENVQFEGDVYLPDNRTVILAVYDGDETQGAEVIPLDLSVPPEGSWRFLFAHLAQDNPDSAIDVWTYPAEGTPKLVAGGIARGQVATEHLPAHTISFEYQPTGVEPDGDYAVTLSMDCQASAFLSVHVIWCDSAELYDGGPCQGVAGGFTLGLSLEDQSCM